MSLKILIDTSPLSTGHSIRGVGVYTKFLVQELRKQKEIELRLSTELNNEKFNPDIIHYPYFDLFFDTLPIIKTKKTIVTVHDVIPLIFPEYYPTGIKGKLRLLKQKQALQFVEAVITDSYTSKNDITKHLNINEKKIKVIYLAANPKIQHPDENKIKTIRRKYQLPLNYLLYVGDINYNKNLAQLIKSLQFLPADIKLVCVGKNFIEQDIPEWRWIEAQLAASQVENRVKFITNILTQATDELSAIYSAALVYIQPSLYEGFGLPILEAMKCQIPVVCCQNSSLIEVGGNSVVFCQPQAEDIAKQVNEVLNWSKTQRTEWIKKAEQWSLKFTWAKVAKETIKVYQQVING